VIDLSGRLVGISSAKMAFTPQGVPTQGMGFAIPADVVRESVDRFKKVAQKQPKAKSQPASAADTSMSSAEKLFGLQLQDLNQELSDALGYLRGRGVLITAVEPESPADDAGLERGLVIYRAGSSETNSVKQIEDLLRGVQSGTKINFTVGIIHPRGQNQQLGTLSMTARYKK
jgi:S1-C subfamily serine protease